MSKKGEDGETEKCVATLYVTMKQCTDVREKSDLLLWVGNQICTSPRFSQLAVAHGYGELFVELLRKHKTDRNPTLYAHVLHGLCNLMADHKNIQDMIRKERWLVEDMTRKILDPVHKSQESIMTWVLYNLVGSAPDLLHPIDMYTVIECAVHYDGPFVNNVLWCLIHLFESASRAFENAMYFLMDGSLDVFWNKQMTPVGRHIIGGIMLALTNIYDPHHILERELVLNQIHVILMDMMCVKPHRYETWAIATLHNLCLCPYSKRVRYDIAHHKDFMELVSTPSPHTRFNREVTYLLNRL